MGLLSLQVPQSGQPNSSEDPKVATDITSIQTWANGNIDNTNISAALAQSAGVNQSGQKVKGATVISASQTVTSTTYTTLATADQVTGIVLASTGLIKVRYWATWQESVAGAARAAVFIGANQLKVWAGSIQAFEAAATNSATPAVNLPLMTSPIGLLSGGYTGTPYAGDVTTGQALGTYGGGVGVVNAEVAGVVNAIPGYISVNIAQSGGALEIDNLPAGTYTISVRFKASSGTVTASNRRLRVKAESYS